jgi:hypothetical protein
VPNFVITCHTIAVYQIKTATMAKRFQRMNIPLFAGDSRFLRAPRRPARRNDKFVLTKYKKSY